MKSVLSMPFCLVLKKTQFGGIEIDCKTVVFFANTSDGRRQCVHIRTKGLERVYKRRGRMGRDAKKYDCPPCIYQIRSKLPVLPATGNSHWSNPDAICHQMLITPHQKDIAAVSVSQERQKFSRDFSNLEIPATDEIHMENRNHGLALT